MGVTHKNLKAIVKRSGGLPLRGYPETNVIQINLLEVSKIMARSRLSSKSVLSLALHMT
jgi:hypothetical protein